MEGSTAIYIGRGSKEEWEIPKNNYDSEDCNFGWLTPWAAQPALTRVSRQIREETLGMYYSMNEFATAVDSEPEFEYHDEDKFQYTISTPVYDLLDWMVSIGQKNFSYLRKVHVRLHPNRSQFNEFGEKRPGSHGLEGDELQIRRWLDNALAADGLEMSNVEMTTRVWCYCNDGFNGINNDCIYWMQTNPVH